MGNWRTVHVRGACGAADLPALRAAVDRSALRGSWDALCWSPSLCGLGDWPAEAIDAVGNGFERDFTVDDVAEHVRALVAACPSLVLRVDCGGEYESDECVATVVVGEDRTVAVLLPQVERLPALGEGVLVERLRGFLA